MRALTIILLCYTAACGPVKVKTESKPVQTVSSGTLNIVVSGNVTATIAVAIQLDPAVKALVDSKCNGDSICEDSTMSNLQTSLMDTIANFSKDSKIGPYVQSYGK